MMLRVVAWASLLALLPACSKTPARANPCDLLPVSEAQALDGTIVKTQWLPQKQGDREELCYYEDANGEPRVMLFVWRHKFADAHSAVRAGMKSAADRVVDLDGIGEKAAAGFSYSEGETLKLFAAETKSGMVGFRVRDPVKESDPKFANLKTAAASALARLK
jgi:hypothetical protein